MNVFISEEALRLKNLYCTSNPFEIMKELGINVIHKEFKSLKGFYVIELKERYVVINSNLSDRDKLLVAAHELGHDRFHQQYAKVAPLKDFRLYDMSSQTEYQANQFASELLIEDKEIEELCKDDSLDYFSLCSQLGYNPHLVTFKLFGMVQRGYKYNLPMDIKSDFLK